MHARDGFVLEPVKDAFAPDAFYVQECFHFEKIKRYFDTFPHEQIKLYLYDQFSSNPLEVMRDIFKFLEVDDNFAPDLEKRYNVAVFPKYRWH